MEAHGHARTTAASRSRSALATTLVLTAGVMVVELVAGLWTGSLALVADAGHMLTDAGALALALFASWIAARPPTPAKTYGYYRAEILAARGLPADVVYAILAHADYSGMPRVSLLDRALYACDELTGFVHACALVRPGKVVAGLEPASVRKKLKDRAFARTVNRDDVFRGAAELGVDLDAHIAFVVEALAGVAPEIGLGRA